MPNRPTYLDHSAKSFFRFPDNNWLPIALLIIITFIALFPCLGLGFVWWDDQWYLLNNKALDAFAHTWSWGAVHRFFVTSGYGNYIPLTMCTYAIEKYFFAPDPYLNPFLFHLDNVLLHIGCTLCVFFLFLQFNIKKWSSFMGALIFGIHPMRVESVAWVTERKDVLYALFFLLALIAYVHSLKGKREVLWYFLAILCSLLACFAKVQAVSLPLCLVAIDFYLKRKWYSPQILLYEKLPWWIFSLGFGLVNVNILKTQKILGSAGMRMHYSLIDKLATGAWSYVVYIAKFIYPWQMQPYYPYPLHPPLIAYIFLVALPLSIVALLWWQRRNRSLIFGIIFFTCNIVFVLQILSASDVFMVDRFTYVAYIGLCFLAAIAVNKAAESLPNTRLFLFSAIAIYITFLCFLNGRQVQVWQNTPSLWAHYNAANPTSYYGYGQLGGYYRSRALHKFWESFQPANDAYLVKLSVYNYSMALAKDSINGCPIPQVTARLYNERASMYILSGLTEPAHNDSLKARHIMQQPSH
ncbi:MAG: hypothetical protein P4L41_07685 [Flavipsychrobacter sp.]|nr:hypothetical protein [Flavipsychrobacter sp.]